MTMLRAKSLSAVTATPWMTNPMPATPGPATASMSSTPGMRPVLVRALTVMWVSRPVLLVAVVGTVRARVRTRAAGAGRG